jgi:hypothetical protein
MSVPVMGIPTPKEFAQLNRVERLHVLRAAQQVYGVDSPEYSRLAATHGHLLRSGQECDQ